MIGKKRLLARLEKLLVGSAADHLEVAYWGNRESVTRYAANRIHQNVQSDRPQVFVRAMVGRRMGLAVTNSLSTADLLRTRESACDIARVQPDNPECPGLPRPRKYRQVEQRDEATIRATPMRRARLVKSFIEVVSKAGLSADGALSVNEIELGIVSTRGVRAHHVMSTASVSVIASGKTSSGYGHGLSYRLQDLEAEAIARRAVDRCNESADPVSVKPGSYEVILEPPALADMLGILSLQGFRSRTLADGTSFMVGRIGRKVTSDKITIQDNAFERGMLCWPFDFEGMPRRKIMLIDRGVAIGGVKQRTSESEAGDGHAPPPMWSHFGVWPWHLVVKAGRVKRDGMIAGVRRGLLVTRLHYVRNCPGSRNDTLTGLTRDGTLLIRNGEIAGGVRNLRFTDSLMRALGTTVAVSRERELVRPDAGGLGVLAPTLHLKSFRFSGNAEA
ncbi:MAG: TldD/PmbA family protein [candidate division Zixibacteria bacterium]|nr:TldD/PmbA family protein [candidate division Zixibacteria bacterium]